MLNVLYKLTLVGRGVEYGALWMVNVLIKKQIGYFRLYIADITRDIVHCQCNAVCKYTIVMSFRSPCQRIKRLQWINAVLPLHRVPHWPCCICYVKCVSCMCNLQWNSIRTLFKCVGVLWMPVYMLTLTVCIYIFHIGAQHNKCRTITCMLKFSSVPVIKWLTHSCWSIICCIISKSLSYIWPLNLCGLIWLLMVWSKRQNINTAAVVTIVLYNTLVAWCSRQLTGPAVWVFVILGPLCCD